MSHIGIRIRQRREELGYSQDELAKKLGYKSRSTINKIEMGVNDITQSKIQAFADALGTTPSNLMGWNNEPCHINDSGCSDEEIYKAGGISVVSYPLIAIIGSVRAGYGGIAYEEIVGYETADVKNPEECFYLVVHGDSMEPDIHDGDLALVRKQSDVDSGDLAVVIINGDEGTLKRVVKAQGALILQPFNPSHETTVITGEMLNEVKIAGKVLYTTSKKRW
ncbi:LexA family transcriptional regulator [Hydrogenoanaerobacterium sp.]|uniref:LexA family protein n=1 Tax=Hydrogenoanaerobacterium sp. TaxID=2953763 RepID=UPI00289FAE2E|nr:LexA family transcriptional regulator [Hydrogenoanaerobacterium sp.]